MRSPTSKEQSDGHIRLWGKVLIALILILAAVLRLHAIGWDLPALYDADEPYFMLLGLRLLREHTLDPGWFGHPGTTTIYTLGAVDLAVYAAGWLSGRFGERADFVNAIYRDPGIIVLPSRVAIMLFGLGTILLTWRLGRRLFDERVGLLAALLMALDPLHVRLSQTIRTDMQMTMLMLLALLAALELQQSGKRRHYALAGFWFGLACATKWPAAVVFSAIVATAWTRLRRKQDKPRDAMAGLALAAIAGLAGLFVGSPYIFIHLTVLLANLTFELRTHHPGATGYGFFGNIGWYTAYVFPQALGWLPLMLVPVGVLVGIRRSYPFRSVALPLLVITFLSICVLSLVWDRWMIPVLPLLSIVAAAGFFAVARWIGDRIGSRAEFATLVVAITATIGQLTLGSLAQAREREHDTRRLASAWARAHVPSGSTVLVEYLAFDLLDTDWRFLFPIGDAGCVDALAQLRGTVSIETARSWKGDRNVVDVGTIEPTRLANCHPDYALLSGYERYRIAPHTYPKELANYRAFLNGGTIEAVLKPVKGAIGGPVVYVVRFGHVTASTRSKIRSRAVN